MQSVPHNMQWKPGFPVANCSIKMPDGPCTMEAGGFDDEGEQQQRRQQLINFGHTQWGFNNWSWAVTKQELDFVELTNGKYCAGVVAFVSVTVKSLDIHRENIGYATSSGNTKGFAIYKSRKCAVTNALRETLLSFGGAVATELFELDAAPAAVPAHSAPVPLHPAPLPAHPAPVPAVIPAHPPPAPAAVPAPLAPPPPSPASENNQNLANRIPEPVSMKHMASRKEPPVARAQPMPSGPRPPRPSNDCKDGANSEEARAERKRRQRLAQEEFRLKQLMKNDDKQELSKPSSSLDSLLLELPSQLLQESETSQLFQETSRPDKRKSPAPDPSTKRRASFSKLDGVNTD